MNSYILFVYGDFNDHHDVEYFCLEHIGGSKHIDEIKHVICSTNNIILFFDSSSAISTLNDELTELLKIDHVTFYFGFQKKDLLMLNIPEKYNEMIFKPQRRNSQNVEKNTNRKLELDTILDKIRDKGIESLTKKEKNFLDNFKIGFFLLIINVVW